MQEKRETLQKKQVITSDVCGTAMSAKDPTPKPCQNMEELKAIVTQFCSTGRQGGGEEHFSTYGYPINQWNTVKLADERFNDQVEFHDDASPPLTFGTYIS
jgi:hypothetical protein